MSKFLKALIVAGLVGSPAAATKYNLGRVALPVEVAAWNIDVRADGQGLPAGSGSVAQGEELFAEVCADCHGDFGEAVGRWPALAGGNDTLADERPVKTVGSYWPYLSTAWDYINRAMPYGKAQSLSADEVYQTVAYILYLNDAVDEDFVLSKENFLTFAMENTGGFRVDDRFKTEYPAFTRVACMDDCKSVVTITNRAILDSTNGVIVLAAATAEETATTEEPMVKEEPATTEEPAASEEPAMVEEAEATEEKEAMVLNEALVKKGKKVFKKCKACHKVGDKAKNSIGPMLNGIYNRDMATNEDFKYSKGIKKMAEDGGVWTDENLRSFLKSPKKFIKKTKMTFRGVKEKDMDAIVEFLKSVSQ